MGLKIIQVKQWGAISAEGFSHWKLKFHFSLLSFSHFNLQCIYIFPKWWLSCQLMLLFEILPLHIISIMCFRWSDSSNSTTVQPCRIQSHKSKCPTSFSPSVSQLFHFRLHSQPTLWGHFTCLCKKELKVYVAPNFLKSKHQLSDEHFPWTTRLYLCLYKITAYIGYTIFWLTCKSVWNCRKIHNIGEHRIKAIAANCKSYSNMQIVVITVDTLISRATQDRL